MGRKNVEFPKLTALNLYSAPITGNGMDMPFSLTFTHEWG